MSEGLQAILNDDGVFEEYDDTYDFTIHCESEEEQEEVLNKLNWRWIPVSKRLPEDKTYVLTTIKVPNRIAHARSGWYEGGFFHNDNGDTWKATDMEVVAWMPLPEPYKAEMESEE